MKLLYIGDNSDSLNLGCRATSIALRQLATQQAEFIGTVPTRMIAARWPLSDTISDASYGTLARVLNTNRARAVPVMGALIGRLMDALGTRDAITHDLARNAMVLERAKSWSADARQLMAWLDEADGALVNGEGDLIFGTPARRRLLFILTLCRMLQLRGKKFYYLNAIASPAPGQEPNRETLALADKVLAQAKAFSLRDTVSLEFAREHLPRAAAKARVFPDAVFTWQPLFENLPLEHSSEALLPFVERAHSKLAAFAARPYVLVGGSSRSAYDKVRAAGAYVPLVERLKGIGLQVVLQPACTGDSFLNDVARATNTPIFPIEAPILAHVALLANARAYVSGRWHPSIMAALGGTPCVFMGSNSHKMIALQSQLGYPAPHEYSPWPDCDEIDRMVAEATDQVAAASAKRSEIRQFASKSGKEALAVTGCIQ